MCEFKFGIFQVVTQTKKWHFGEETKWMYIFNTLNRNSIHITV